MRDTATDTAMTFDTGHPAAHVLIIGGGASGVLMAAQLLSLAPATRVTIIEKSAMLGCGIAYATDNPDHLLNTRVHNMSAFPDDPDHFLRWLHRSGEAPQATGACFVGRQTYGRYLGSLIAGPTEDRPEGRHDRRLRCLRDDCTRLDSDPDGVRAHLKTGAVLSADVAILATGHAVSPTPGGGLRGGWDFTPPASPDVPVVIIGTGLSMVDHVVSLIGSGHRGQITCLSRRGLLPRAHAPATAMTIDRDALPIGGSVSQVLHWLRRQARQAEAKGGTWRDAVDGVRPHVTAIWQSWDREERRRFLRHAASWWEVHRHRMPPRSAEVIARAQARGQLALLKARFEEATPDGPLCKVRITTSAGDLRRMTGHVIDCRGIRRDPETASAAVVLDLIARGAARVDSLRLGLDTTEDARLIDRDGRPSDRVFAIGPCARGALWEITAIPDIRVQCTALAASLSERLAL